MFNRYTHHRDPLLPWLLFLAVALRSLVAPGYEFINAGEHGGFRLSVAWCPGLNGINLTAGLDGPGHSHDQNPDDQGGSDHFTATCGLWTGTTSFVNHNAPLTEGLADAGSERYLLPPYPTHAAAPYRRNHPARAPPLSRPA